MIDSERHLPVVDVTLADAESRPLRAGMWRLTHRGLVVAVSFLFVLPTAIFSASLHIAPSLLVLAGCVGALALVASDRRTGDIQDSPVDGRRLLAAITIAAALLLLGGETHTFYATPDWQIRDAVLADLARSGFPVTYHVADVDYLLRAPLGMYMIPASIGHVLGSNVLGGHVLGLAAAHAALLAQNALLLGSIFYLLAKLGRGWPHLALLILFGGLSIAGAMLRIGLRPAAAPDFWQWSLDAWNPHLQFSSAMVQFFWVPNHALPGWWLATLFLLQRRGAIDVATLGVSVAALIFWSPLAAVPAVPWLVVSAVTRWRDAVLSLRTWLGVLTSACFLPVALYLVAASASIAHGASSPQADFGFWYATFMLVQLPVVPFLLVFWRRVPADLRMPLVLNVVFLLALPMFRFGPNNDLVMRASTAPLVVVAFAFGSVLLDLTRERALAAWIGWALATAAAPSAALEIGRAVTTPAYRISDCSVIQASREVVRPAFPTNYLAPLDAMPPGLVDDRHASMAPVEARTCWPDLP